MTRPDRGDGDAPNTCTMKKSPFAKLKKAFLAPSSTSTQSLAAKCHYDETGVISPSNSKAPLNTTAGSPMSMGSLQQSGRQQQQNNNNFNQQHQQQQSTDEQQRRLAELYAAQRASSPRLASRDEISGRHAACRAVPAANDRTGSSSYDDELSRQLQLATLADRREIEERQSRIQQLREYEKLQRKRPAKNNRHAVQQDDRDAPITDETAAAATNATTNKQHGSQKKNQRVLHPTTNNARPETSTQSTKSETSSEMSNTSDAWGHPTMDSRWKENVWGSPSPSAVGNQSSDHNRSATRDGDDSKKVRSGNPTQQHQQPQQQKQRQPRRKSMQRQTPPPTSGLTCIHEEHSPIEHEWSFDEIQVQRDWSFGWFDHKQQPFDEQPLWQQFDDEQRQQQKYANNEKNNSNPQHEEYDDEGRLLQRHVHFNPHHGHNIDFENDPSRCNPQTTISSRKNPSLTIDVVSDVSFHDDPSIDMMSSLGTNDTNSLTDYSWRNHRSSLTVMDPIPQQQEETEDYYNNNNNNNRISKKKRNDARRINDPPGTLIDDISSSVKRIRNPEYYSGDPSKRGDSTPYSQPSVTRNQTPKRNGSTSGLYGQVEGMRDRPWRKQTEQQQQRGFDFKHDSTNPSKPVSQPSASSPSPSSDQWPKEPWDIEFISPVNADFQACEASSLGNLTEEYGEEPPEDERGDDDTATNTMNTVDLVAEVKRVWRHVQKYEKKKQKKKDLIMAQYNRHGDEVIEEEEEEEPNIEAMMSHLGMQDPNNEVSLDDTRVSNLTGFSQINATGGAMRSFGAGAPINNGRRSPLEEHIRSTRGFANESSPGRSFNNASHASTEKDVAFVNDGVDSFFHQAQAQNANIVHHRVPLSHHHKSTHHSSQRNFGISQDAEKSMDNHLAQPYDMTKSKSTGTALSSKTQKTSNRATISSIYATQNENSLSGKSGSNSSNHTPSPPRQNYNQTHRARVDMARKYMKRHGGAHFPRSRSPLVPPSDVQQSQEQVVNGNSRISITHGNGKKSTSFRVT